MTRKASLPKKKARKAKIKNYYVNVVGSNAKANYNASWTLKSNIVGDDNNFVMKYTYVTI